MKAEDSILGHSENRVEKYRPKLLDAEKNAYNAQGLKEHIDRKVSKPLKVLTTLNAGLTYKTQQHIENLQKNFPHRIINKNGFKQQTNPFSDTELIATAI